MNDLRLACCGLNCETCEIRLAPFEPVAADVVLKWFKSEGWLSEDEGMSAVLERKMYCTGCLGDSETQWSADCWILQCCVDDHHLENCSQCPDFPCTKLTDWSHQDTSYHHALENLKRHHTRRASN